MTLLRLPLAIARFLWGFVNPQRTAGRVALGRVAILTQVVAALIFVGYTLHKKDFVLPLLPDSSYTVEIVFPDAKGLDTADNPAAAVAGNPSGQVTKVEYRDGRARVTVRLDAKLEGRIFADASAQLRPASALQNLLVNISPGTPEKGPLPEGRAIAPERTTVFPAIDDVTGIFDADTQAYTAILLHEARRALRGREGRMREAIAKLADLTDPATSVSRALATRRRLLARLVGHLDVIFRTVGRRGDQLAAAIAAGNRTLQVTDSRREQLAAVTRKLAPVVVEARRSLAAVRELANPLIPALTRLNPTGKPFARSMARTRALVPRLERLLDLVSDVQRRGARPMELLLEGTRGLKGRVRALQPTAEEIVTIARLLDQYKEGAAQLATTLSGIISIQDRGGPYSQVDVLKLEAPRPENFGLPPSASAAQRARMKSQLAAALERVCRRGSAAACLTRFNVPGLSARPVTRRKAG
jgi:phospholipid/cholesterol/gamma-HCH transport system substrate-binding protein